ncbi:MAG: phosphate signaling complex protein PhoU, partial [Caldilineaceae bacterium]|nr:phosphate signaling complex protein PhoU [Caldilineaceae bacterium]
KRMIRGRFEQQLTELRDDILRMGKLVEEELLVALQALETMDVKLAQQVHTMDDEVNRVRFETEEKCFTVIVTQQPAARDLRTIVSVMNIIVDLERMGDQAKGIAKVIPRLRQQQKLLPLPELKQMGTLVLTMLRQSMQAYASDSVTLARLVAAQDNEVDKLYGQVFSKLVNQMADDNLAEEIESSYERLRVARELERFGDLATNIAERVIYRVTGQLKELNTDARAQP